MFFSVIVPTRNEFLRLQYCLPSLLAQTFSDFEILIIEDPETSDQTREYLAHLRDPRIKYFVHEKGLKVPAKRNWGATKAVGDFLYFIDADMEFPPQTLDSLRHQILATRSQLVFVSEQTPGKEWLSRMKNLEKQVIRQHVALCAARVYERQLFLRLGGYNPNLIVGEEVDLSDRAVNVLSDQSAVESLSDQALNDGLRYVVSQVVINHYETSDASLVKHFQKKFKYGMSTGQYFAAKIEERKAGKNEISNQRATTSRLIYFTSKETWTKPLLGLQFIVFKFTEMVCLGLGLIYAKLFFRQIVTTR